MLIHFSKYKLVKSYLKYQKSVASQWCKKHNIIFVFYCCSLGCSALTWCEARAPRRTGASSTPAPSSPSLSSSSIHSSSLEAFSGNSLRGSAPFRYISSSSLYTSTQNRVYFLWYVLFPCVRLFTNTLWVIYYLLYTASRYSNWPKVSRVQFIVVCPEATLNNNTLGLNWCLH